jgi:pimeloyl-ACP methyl ester carboxylesterase
MDHSSTEAERNACLLSQGSALSSYLLPWGVAWMPASPPPPQQQQQQQPPHPPTLPRPAGASVNHWRNQFELLPPEGYRVHAVDLLGFGASDKPREVEVGVCVCVRVCVCVC